MLLGRRIQNLCGHFRGCPRRCTEPLQSPATALVGILESLANVVLLQYRQLRVLTIERFLRWLAMRLKRSGSLWRIRPASQGRITSKASLNLSRDIASSPMPKQFVGACSVPVSEPTSAHQ